MPDGAPRRGEEHARKIPAGLVAYVTEALSMSADEATEWAESKLNGHTVRNVDNYIRRCVENYSPPKPKPASSNGSKPGTRCDFHWQEQPCSGCAADRKVAGAEYKPAGVRTLENIAAILGVQPVPCQDDDDGNQQIELTRAGLDFGAYTNLPDQHITIYSEYSAASPGEWPEGQPLPDEPFQGRAINTGATGSPWEYRPHDAVQLAERWHEQTSNVGTKTQAWRAIEKIASILDVELDHYEHDLSDELDEDELTAEAQQAGLNFVAWASKTDQTVTVSCEPTDANSPWPDSEPLPDTRFHDRAISGDDVSRKYYPADAITIAEHWHEQTRAIAKEIPA